MRRRGFGACCVQCVADIVRTIVTSVVATIRVTAAAPSNPIGMTATTTAVAAATTTTYLSQTGNRRRRRQEEPVDVVVVSWCDGCHHHGSQRPARMNVRLCSGLRDCCVGAITLLGLVGAGA